MASDYDSYDYHSYWQGRLYEDESEKCALRYFFKKLPLKKTLLDVGGGYGRLSSVYDSVFEKAVVLDPAEKNLLLGKKLFSRQKNISFVKGSLPELPFEDNQFETVLMIRVSHHLNELLPSFNQINRILTKNGFFIFEFANKNHFWALLRAFLGGNFKYASNESPVEKRSPESIKENKITFVNHHPKKVLNDLSLAGFEIKEILSVSNFRNPIIKKIIPTKALLLLEKLLQKPLAGIYFGPSIFLFCQKKML